jgi:hydrogenase maturation protease
VLIGGVGELYQGDLDVGRVAVERLATEDLGDHVAVEDLHYGAVAVAQRLEELQVGHLVLVGGVVRGRLPGSVERRRVEPRPATATEVQLSVGDAVTGYVSIDLVVEVAAGLGVLPARTVTVEVEPASTKLSDHLTPEARAGLERALELVRAEALRAPLLDLAARIERRCADGEGGGSEGPAPRPLVDVLRAVRVMGDEGRWDRAAALRERLGRELEEHRGDNGDVVDRAAALALLDELDRVLGVEAGR